MSFNSVRKPFKVEFYDGPYNGAIRYYSSLRVVRSVARRYVRRPIAGRFIFRHPSCDIFEFVPSFGVVFLETII